MPSPDQSLSDKFALETFLSHRQKKNAVNIANFLSANY